MAMADTQNYGYSLIYVSASSIPTTRKGNTTRSRSVSCINCSHLSASTLRSVPASIVTCQCFRSSPISVVVWFLAISSVTRSRHLSFGLPRFHFPSTFICNIFLVASSLSCLMSKPSQPLLSEEFCQYLLLNLRSPRDYVVRSSVRPSRLWYVLDRQLLNG